MISAEELKALSLPQLLDLMRRLGISVAGIEDNANAAYTKLVSHAISIAE